MSLDRIYLLVGRQAPVSPFGFSPIILIYPVTLLETRNHTATSETQALGAPQRYEIQIPDYVGNPETEYSGFNQVSSYSSH